MSAALGAGVELLEIPISALEHFVYCPRQCALIHVEQAYEENLFTVRGTLAHRRVDSGASTAGGGLRTVRSLPLWSDRLGLVGKADVVEFHATGPLPIEYKSGRASLSAEIQLCAQALCLEEMFQQAVPEGALYSRSSKHRRRVRFDEKLRAKTLATIDTVRSMLSAQFVPPAPNDARCPPCSLVNACLPAVVAGRARLRNHQHALFSPQLLGDGPDD